MRILDSARRLALQLRAVAALIGTTVPAGAAFAGDMAGPDRLKLLLAFPMLVVYAIGELALFLAPLFLALAVLTALLRRFGVKLADHLPGAAAFLVLAILAGVPALVYWIEAPAPSPSSDPFNSYRTTKTRDAKVDPLAPPVRGQGLASPW